MSIKPSGYDRKLKEFGLMRKHIAKDETCLFRCISEIVYFSQLLYEQVKEQLILYVTENFDFIKSHLQLNIEDKDDLVNEISSVYFKGSLRDLFILCLLYKRNVFIFRKEEDIDPKFFQGSDDMYENCINLLYEENVQHFDLIYPCSYIKIKAISQSIIYESLYRNVFRYNDDQLHKVTKLMLDEKLYSRLKSERKSFEKSHGSNCFKMNRVDPPAINGTCLNCFDENQKMIQEAVTEKNQIQNPPIPYKIAKCLSNLLYRNELFDAWCETNSTKLHDYLSLTFVKIGSGCSVNLDGKSFKGFVIEILNNDLVNVFIEELNQSHLFNANTIKLIPCLRMDRRLKKRIRKFKEINETSPINNGNSTNDYTKRKSNSINKNSQQINQQSLTVYSTSPNAQDVNQTQLSSVAYSVIENYPPVIINGHPYQYVKFGENVYLISCYLQFVPTQYDYQQYYNYNQFYN